MEDIKGIIISYYKFKDFKILQCQKSPTIYRKREKLAFWYNILPY